MMTATTHYQEARLKLIRVELKDGATCRMVPKALQLFLDKGLVRRFERSDGWVSTDQGPLRQARQNVFYQGPERRSHSFASVRVNSYRPPAPIESSFRQSADPPHLC